MQPRVLAPWTTRGGRDLLFAVACTALSACAYSADRARLAEDGLIRSGVVFPVSNAPLLRIVAFWTTENAIGIPEINLRVYNSSSAAIRAYRITARLKDDFGGGACTGGKSEQTLEAQAENLQPGQVSAGRWTLNLCSRATRFEVSIAEVVMIDGSIWRAFP